MNTLKTMAIASVVLAGFLMSNPAFADSDYNESSSKETTTTSVPVSPPIVVQDRAPAIVQFVPSYQFDDNGRYYMDRDGRQQRGMYKEERKEKIERRD